METVNISLMPYFILSGFSGGPVLHNTIFVALLLVYLVTLTGNVLIIFIIYNDHRLHSPMYFFLLDMSVMETFGISAVIPKFLSILIAEKRISVTGCHIQTFIYFFIASSVFLLLAVMSFDRFVAICHPLRYTVIMRHQVCVLLVCLCLVICSPCISYMVIQMVRLPYCDFMLNHFFCDIAAMLKLVCADISFLKCFVIITSSFIVIIPLMIIIVSYMLIVYTVMKIPTQTIRKKTFSTCVSHLSIVCIAFGSAIFIQIRPSHGYSVETDKCVHLISTILPPLVNPYIYTLRNEQVKKSIKDAARGSKHLQ